jgi:nitrogen-specific signal transduction histidine kinase
LLQHVTALLDTQGILHNIQIVTKIDPSLPLIECDGNGLKQVFINFLKNAMEAMKNGGRIFIETQKKRNIPFLFALSTKVVKFQKNI